MHVDHIKPLFRKSLHKKINDSNIDNYNPSCSKCNCLKHCKTIEEFKNYIRQKIAFLAENDAMISLLVNLDVVKISDFNLFYYEIYNKE